MAQSHAAGENQDQEMTAILGGRTIAVVGLSAKEETASNRVAKYLIDKGYRVIPVNPKYKEVLGQKSYPDLKSIPVHIDVVDIFRQLDAISATVDAAIDIKAGAVWMQLNLIDEEAAARARKAGLRVVMDKCIKVEHNRLCR